VQRVLPVVGNVRYAAPGYLVFGQNGKLMAQRFDAGKLRLEGDASRLLTGSGVTRRRLSEFPIPGSWPTP
jgi:hypothetical protein